MDSDMSIDPDLEQPPTRRWLEQAQLRPLTGPEGTAESLLLLLHYSIDWDGWVGAYRASYWDGLLTDRVLVAAYRSATLATWWSDVAAELGAAPRTQAQRRELAQLLEHEPVPVLSVMRSSTEALQVRLRLVADAVRAARADREQEQ